MRRRLLCATTCLLLPLAAWSQEPADVRMTLTLDTLNRAANRIGDLSDAGLFQPEPPAALGTLFRNCLFFGRFDCLEAPQTQRPASKHPEAIPLARCVAPDGSVRLLPLPDAAPIAWQWWITDGEFTVEGNQLRFAASVRARIGSRWSKHTGSAGAEIRLSGNKEHAMVQVGDFKVPLEATLNGTVQQITTVDVGELRSFSVALHPQPLSIPLPDGSSKPLTMKVSTLKHVHYTPDAIELDLDVHF